MPRKKCFRHIEGSPLTTYYKPAGTPLHKIEVLMLSMDEFEALRLADLHGDYQEVAAEKMKVSRQTFGRILAEAHRKVADALINAKAIKIEQNNSE